MKANPSLRSCKHKIRLRVRPFICPLSPLLSAPLTLVVVPGHPSSATPAPAVFPLGSFPDRHRLKAGWKKVEGRPNVTPWHATAILPGLAPQALGGGAAEVTPPSPRPHYCNHSLTPTHTNARALVHTWTVLANISSHWPSWNVGP